MLRQFCMPSRWWALQLVENLVLALVNLQYELNAGVRLVVVGDTLSLQPRPHTRRLQLQHVGLDVSRILRHLVEKSLTHYQAYESTCMWYGGIRRISLWPFEMQAKSCVVDCLMVCTCMCTPGLVTRASSLKHSSFTWPGANEPYIITMSYVSEIRSHP